MTIEDTEKASIIPKIDVRDMWILHCGSPS